MATIASLVVSLGMETAKFTKGALEGKKSLADLAHAAQALGGGIGILKEVGHVIEGTLAQFTNEGAAIRSLKALSDKTGITTQSLATLEHVAGPAFDSLTAGLQKMGINLVEADKAGDKANPIFKDLGLNVKELSQISQDAAFAKIADAIKDLPTPAEKAAAAVEIFGKSGGDLVNILNKGSEGLAEARDHADKLGLTFDNLAATQVAQATQAFADFEHAIAGLKRSLVIELAPAFTAASTTWKYFIENVKQGNLLFAYTDAVRSAANELNTAKIDSKPLKTAKAIAKPKDEIKDLADELGKSAEKDQQERDQLMQQNLSPLEKYRAEVDKIAAALTRLHNAHLLNVVDDKKFAEQKAGLQAAMQRVGAEEAKRRQDEMAKQGEKIKSLRDSLKTPAEQVAEQLKEIDDAQSKGQLDADHARLGRLKAERTLLDSLPDERDQGSPFARAALQGSAEAFHASLGQTPVDKKTAEIARNTKEAAEINKKIFAKLFPMVIGH